MILSYFLDFKILNSLNYTFLVVFSAAKVKQKEYDTFCPVNIISLNIVKIEVHDHPIEWCEDMWAHPKYKYKKKDGSRGGGNDYRQFKTNNL